MQIMACLSLKFLYCPTASLSLSAAPTLQDGETEEWAEIWGAITKGKLMGNGFIGVGYTFWYAGTLIQSQHTAPPSNPSPSTKATPTPMTHTRHPTFTQPSRLAMPFASLFGGKPMTTPTTIVATLG
ncbi:hypothetical protein DEU56DRAFT_757812 [Suillus clintonianus]|uniref:uncharacterized protein n=1 Tax=Suillus clintonianus TaxID=1904413 RepID=UPI001B871170|nr:uncharacterized protein DEU56DRAFT_757812 [Suillus clintonianus]KAG2130744.1 hypothetical protein DEU56DRAFT_757812 [Suillus clintonianus]